MTASQSPLTKRQRLLEESESELDHSLDSSFVFTQNGVLGEFSSEVRFVMALFNSF